MVLRGTLDPAAHYVGPVDTMAVESEGVDELLEGLPRAARLGMSQPPGFMSANLHVSQDKPDVADYAQWCSQADAHPMTGDEAARAQMRSAASIATSYDPLFYGPRESVAADRLDIGDRKVLSTDSRPKLPAPRTAAQKPRPRQSLDPTPDRSQPGLPAETEE